MSEIIDEVSGKVQERFSSSGRLLSFQDYLDAVEEAPYAHLRSAAQYCADMFDHFGRYNVQRIGEPLYRFRIFDAPNGGEPVFGQEKVQAELHRCLQAFAEDGRPDKLIVLTGPNGSSKSSLVDLIFRGMETYSYSPQGALYRFNWVFPNRKIVGESIGFGADAGRGSSASFAHLGQKEIQAKLVCELKDHPILLLPKPAREDLIERFESAGSATRNLRFVLDDELCAKCRGIYEALLDDYSGDWARVVQHVQVQRFTISRRYRVGAITIEPQGNVDATAKQVTADRSLGNLPPSLQSLNLIEPSGDLIDANGGAIEYSDLLKRSVEANKYLLTTCEKRTISLPGFMAYLNLVMFATTNEKQLDQFKQDRIFTSFKGRMELIPTPYLLELSREEQIYERMLKRMGQRRHIAPGTGRAAALWAVLTRLNRPVPDRYETSQKGGIAKLSPLEKAELYESGQAPRRLPADARRKLVAALPALRDEYEGTEHYEGRYGISPREIRAVLVEAAARPNSPCIGPEAVLDEIEALVKNRTLYDFLQIEASGGYHDVEEFIRCTRRDALRRLDEDLTDAVGLVSEEEYDRRFDRYFDHIKAQLRSEKVPNPTTGQLEDPDEALMEGMEALFDLPAESKADAIRRDYLLRIGGWAHEHAKLDVSKHYREIFEDLFGNMKRKIREANQERVGRLRANILKLGTDEERAISAAERAKAGDALQFLVEERGYCDSCAKAGIVFLLKHESEIAELDKS
ncbi:MAG: serine protein kinase [Gemmatimonadetes bacterium]|nr:serine protein kinase [Gemmatimonadota bacterium]